uniref:Lysosomal-associated transmembrane protein 4B n=1 Tax=Pavo cristatus TaxID=9049 RepID=A0A8C9FEN5_PAVCR
MPGLLLSPGVQFAQICGMKMYMVYFLYIMIKLFSLQGYLISCVWNCYRYINGRNNSEVLVYITTNDTAVLLPPYDDPANGAAKDPPPPYVSA